MSQERLPQNHDLMTSCFASFLSSRTLLPHINHVNYLVGSGNGHTAPLVLAESQVEHSGFCFIKSFPRFLVRIFYLRYPMCSAGDRPPLPSYSDAGLPRMALGSPAPGRAFLFLWRHCAPSGNPGPIRGRPRRRPPRHVARAISRGTAVSRLLGVARRGAPRAAAARSGRAGRPAVAAAQRCGRIPGPGGARTRAEGAARGADGGVQPAVGGAVVRGAGAGAVEDRHARRSQPPPAGQPGGGRGGRGGGAQAAAAERTRAVSGRQAKSAKRD
jgi:hypothetical protein